jgi:hypothetical protein
LKETISAIEAAMEKDTIDGAVLIPLPRRTQKGAAESSINVSERNTLTGLTKKRLTYIARLNRNVIRLNRNDFRCKIEVRKK